MNDFIVVELDFIFGLFIYVEFWCGVDVFIRKVGEEQFGLCWVYLLVLMMLLFCLEVYFNYVGFLLFGVGWNDGWQVYGMQDVWSKLLLVCVVCGVELELFCKYCIVVLILLELCYSLGQVIQVWLLLLGILMVCCLFFVMVGDLDELVFDLVWSLYCECSVVFDYCVQLCSLLVKLYV